MPNRPVLQPVAVAGAVAISASLIGFAALPQSSQPAVQTRAIALTAGDTDLSLLGIDSANATDAGILGLLDSLPASAPGL